jgi:hypothetical protein
MKITKSRKNNNRSHEIKIDKMKITKSREDSCNTRGKGRSMAALYNAKCKPVFLPNWGKLQLRQLLLFLAYPYS